MTAYADTVKLARKWMSKVGPGKIGDYLRKCTKSDWDGTATECYTASKELKLLMDTFPDKYVTGAVNRQQTHAKGCVLGTVLDLLEDRWESYGPDTLNHVTTLLFTHPSTPPQTMRDMSKYLSSHATHRLALLVHAIRDYIGEGLYGERLTRKEDTQKFVGVAVGGVEEDLAQALSPRRRQPSSSSAALRVDVGDADEVQRERIAELRRLLGQPKEDDGRDGSVQAVLHRPDEWLPYVEHTPHHRFELMLELKQMVPDKASDARDAAAQTIRIVDKILSGEPAVAVLSELYDHLCFWHLRGNLGVEAAKKFAGKVERSTMVRPERRAAWEAALAEGKKARARTTAQGAVGRWSVGSWGQGGRGNAVLHKSWNARTAQADRVAGKGGSGGYWGRPVGGGRQ